MDRIPLWIDIRGADDAILQAARAHADAVLGDGAIDGVRSIVVDGNQLLEDGQAIGTVVRMEDGAAQAAAAEAQGIVLVEGRDWTIIPLENLIAARRDRPGTLFALATSAAQCGVFRDTLETGVHGIVLRPESADDVATAHRILVEKGVPSVTASASGDGLVEAEITAIEDAGPGDRVCVDTTSIFEPGEGLLVGSTHRSFALVHAETIETEYVRARPFRVNAGAVHSYLMGPDGRTQYLSEVQAGSQVLAVAPDGTTRTLTVGRAKIERRPHFLVRWTTRNGPGSAIVQNAETIRLVRPDGQPISVTELNVGDHILVQDESAARHFGMPVDERLEER